MGLNFIKIVLICKRPLLSTAYVLHLMHIGTAYQRAAQRFSTERNFFQMNHVFNITKFFLPEGENLKNHRWTLAVLAGESPVAHTDRSHRSGCAEAQEPPRPAWSRRAGTRVCAGDAEQVCDCQPTQRGCTTLATAKIKASADEVQLHVRFALMPLDTVEGVPGEPFFDSPV